LQPSDCSTRPALSPDATSAGRSGTRCSPTGGTSARARSTRPASQVTGTHESPSRRNPVALPRSGREAGLGSDNRLVVVAPDARTDPRDVRPYTWIEIAVPSPELRTRWMSPGGAKPLTSPVKFVLVPASTRQFRFSSSVNSSSCSMPWMTPNTHQVTWSWVGVTWPGCQTRATIEKLPSEARCGVRD
jgi:hypothetical protein